MEPTDTRDQIQVDDSDAFKVSESESSDDLILKRLGYKQELYRGFTTLSSFTFCFTAVAVISSLAGLFPVAMIQGGPVVLIWSWIIGSCTTTITALCLAEICSTYPTAGSVYHWAGCMAPAHLSPAISYVTGYFNVFGNAAGDAFFGYAFASNVASLSALTGTKISVPGQVCIAIMACILWALQNLSRTDHQAIMNNFAGLWQVSTMLIIVVSLIVSAAFGHAGIPQNAYNITDAFNNTTPNNATGIATLSQVFFTYYDGTGFNSPVYVVLIGMLSTMYSFTGYEAAAHMSEESIGASRSAPLGIAYTAIATSITGFLFILGLLFAVASDVPAFVSLEYSVIQILINSLGYTSGIVLSILLIVNMYFSGMSSMTVTTRIVYAMSRDAAFPMSEKIQATTTARAPIGAILVVLIADVLLILLNLVSTNAFISVTSVATIGYQISYAVPILLRITVARNSFVQGAFSLKDASVPMGCIALTTLVATSVLFLLPTSAPVTPETFNYSGVVVLCGAVVAGAYWAVYARHVFTGPPRL